MSQLSDQELIQLVQEKLPDELTETELDQLRQRLRVSAELRDTLLEQLHFESYLNEALGKFEVSVEEIVAVGASSGGNRLGGYWGWKLALLLGLLLSSVLLVVLFTHPKPQSDPAIADTEKAKPDEEQAAKKKADEAEQVAQTKKPAETKPNVTTVAPATNPAEGPAPQAGQLAAVDPTQVWKQEYDAELFARGNIKIDDKNMGQGIGVIYADDLQPVFAEYDVSIPQGGKYRVDLRYAAKVQRPLKLLVNGQSVLTGIARSTTKDWKPANQAWFPAGEIELPAGQNVIRIEADPPPKQKRLGQFPALDKFSLT